eukprot:8153754-Lingulodinium_polyedra.AAC.1
MRSSVVWKSSRLRWCETFAPTARRRFWVSTRKSKVLRTAGSFAMNGGRDDVAGGSCLKSQQMLWWTFPN